MEEGERCFRHKHVRFTIFLVRCLTPDGAPQAERGEPVSRRQKRLRRAGCDADKRCSRSCRCHCGYLCSCRNFLVMSTLFSIFSQRLGGNLLLGHGELQPPWPRAETPEWRSRRLQKKRLGPKVRLDHNDVDHRCHHARHPQGRRSHRHLHSLEYVDEVIVGRGRVPGLAVAGQDLLDLREIDSDDHVLRWLRSSSGTGV